MPKKALYYIPLLVVACLCSLLAHSQLKADFTVDKDGGCAPLLVAFTSTTTGASASALFEWKFGNGNSAILPNAKAAFLDIGSYTVTLTVTDGSQVSTATKNIQVYNAPVVAFNTDITKGCFPLAVNLTSTSTPGDGTITNYFWDFGDGFTASTSDASFSHSFIAAGKPQISLTVTNSFGCQSSLLRKDLLNVLPELKPEFAPDKNFLCFITDPVSFTNTSSGPGTLSYAWDFGDGETSTAKTPTHVFKNPGGYLTKLTVNSSEGCTITRELPGKINVANFVNDFVALDPLCSGNSPQFENKSTPIPDRTTWDFGNGYTYTFTPEQPTYGYFPNAGQQTVKITNEFGACKSSISKIFTVHLTPKLESFKVEIKGECGAPVDVQFTDTSTTAVKWEWSFGYYEGESTEKNPLHRYQQNSHYPVTLQIEDKNGCKAAASELVKIQKPPVEIDVSYPNDHGSDSPNGSCGPLTVAFKAKTTETITAYNWEFGDGEFSTEISPTHVFRKEGSFRTVLHFTTDKGCVSEVAYDYNYFHVTDSIHADFTTSNTVICGNTPVEFTNASSHDGMFYWTYGDGSEVGWTAYKYGNSFHKYESEGKYTVMGILYYGSCIDTVIKENYITVLPPFPKITGHEKTCEGTRGKVVFSQASKQTDYWDWDFGDGSTLHLTTDQPKVEHEYTKTGFFMVRLTTARGTCVVKDSIFIEVVLKRQPVLTADRTTMCAISDYITLEVKYPEKLPTKNDNFAYGNWYRLENLQYSDGTLYQWGGSQYPGSPSGETHPDGFLLRTYNFEPGKKDLRLIVNTGALGCTDTTNYVSVQFKGPKAKFKQVIEDPCANGNVVKLEDITYLSENRPINQWELFWGEGPIETFTQGPDFSHSYYYQQKYPVAMRITDVDGCVSVYGDSVTTQSHELVASFQASATNISPGTQVDFINTSLSSEPANTTHKWLLGDGTTLTSLNASKTYTQPGTYKVYLVSVNNRSGCTDTAEVTILVKYVNAAFAINSSFISSSTCPPVLVNFSNTSSNITKINWDFGDGTIVDNVYNPSHVYTKPGFYLVKLTTTSENGTTYSTLDSIRIKDQSASLKADKLSGCTDQIITFNSVAENIVSYTWDFGDGSVLQTADSFATHHFKTPGIYKPTLVVTNDAGCSSSVKLPGQVVIDKLDISLNNIPATICSPKTLNFIPVVTSVSGNQSASNLVYHWNFGTGVARDTANTLQADFTYSNPGKFNIALSVQSAYGCKQSLSKPIEVFQGLGGYIDGPVAFCQDETISFLGKTQIAGQPKWSWIFPDGSSYGQQNPPAMKFPLAGTLPLKLVVDNGGCADTVIRMLTVHPKPVNILSEKLALLCEGAGMSITAANASEYAWTPSTGLNSNTGATVQANPAADIVYTVTATSEFGCSAKESIAIQVAHPFTVQLASEDRVCLGEPIELAASGAMGYQWINETGSLSNPSTSNPVAHPVATTTYTVVGKDQANCFTDTASIRVVVMPLPTIDAGADVELNPGDSYLLKTIASSDVILYTWTPASYLSCSNCPAPETRPSQPMEYTVTVTNSDGCVASDKIAIALNCKDSKVYIPNAFTPNKDGKNDKFHISGSGITKANYLRIFNRFGQLVFERKNFSLEDRANDWDGYFKGQQVPAGTYVYFLEMNCLDQVITRKGSLVVVY